FALARLFTSFVQIAGQTIQLAGGLILFLHRLSGVTLPKGLCGLASRFGFQGLGFCYFGRRPRFLGQSIGLVGEVLLAAGKVGQFISILLLIGFTRGLVQVLLSAGQVASTLGQLFDLLGADALHGLAEIGAF